MRARTRNWLAVYKGYVALNTHTQSPLPKLTTPLNMKFLMCVLLAAVALSAVSAGYIRSGWNGGYGGWNGGYGSGYGGGWNRGYSGYSSPIVISSGYGGYGSGYGHGYGNGYGNGWNRGGWW
ncbi:neuropeptide-like protein 31 [Maniola hyperantus]|uniref:neuropeptide-like protein 31 n=1 Tax=Aphantopus hyperantus TaxID=2795564 RepID=UPI0037499A0D